jgi:beta-lactamase superfamily II metal-dependent hydrolase
MYDIDFLAVENGDSSSTHSGDAIIMHYTVPGRVEPVIVVLDGGYDATGDQVVDHIWSMYQTDRVDLVISTHPDNDHLNGLKAVLERCRVDALWIHQPDLYVNATEMSNHDKLVEILGIARSKGIPISEPFAGLTAFGNSITVLGPTRDYYLSLVDDLVGTQKARGGFGALSASGVVKAAVRTLSRVLAFFPEETLGDDDDLSARNQSSAIVLLDVDGSKLLFTGDAGIEALGRAAGGYELLHGPFSSAPLRMFQVPHHGSKHNLGPTILDRILGKKGAPHGSTTAISSSSKMSEKHPSPKVTNALGRRGVNVFATEGGGVWFHSPDRTRTGWTSLTPISPLEEGDN